MSQKNEGTDKKVDRTRVSKSFRARKVLYTASSTYRKADAVVIETAKKVVPQRTLNQLSQNKSKNNGNLKITLPVKLSQKDKVSLVVPGFLSKVRHASLPVAIIVIVAVFAFAGASPPSYSWTKKMGGPGDERATDVAVDSLGNIYATGLFQGTVDFAEDWSEEDSKTSSGTGLNYDIFVTKTNANGTYGWTKIIDGQASDTGLKTSLATDASNNIYLTGSFEGTVDFAEDWSADDEKTSNGNTDVFISKINTNGTYGWTKQIGGTGTDTSSDIAVDSTGAINIAGQFTESITFDEDFGGTSETKTSNTASVDGFITKIDSSGNYVSTHQVGGAGTDEITSLATDASNNIYLTGSFEGTVDFAEDWSADDEKTSNGNTDVFISKINTNGTYGWTKQIGGTGADQAAALAVNDGNHIFATGIFQSATIDFGADWSEPDVKNRVGTLDSYLLEIGATQEYVSTKTIGGATSTVQLNDIAIDSDNNIFLGGNLDGAVNLGTPWGATSEKVSEDNGLLIKVMADNSFKWAAVSDATNGAVSVSALAVNSEGTVYSAGHFSDSVDFGAEYDTTDAKTSTSSSKDVFITKVMRGSDAHTIADADGLTFKNEEGINLSSTGTTETSPTVYIYNQSDDALIATIGVDLTENRDWSSISGASDTSTNKTFINNAIGAPGATESLTLYVPKGDSDTAVALCPGAESLEAVTATCASKYILTDDSEDVAVQTIEEVDYWVIANIDTAKIGGLSVDKPRVMITETDESTEVTEGLSTDFVEVKLDARPASDVVVQIEFEQASEIEAVEAITFTSTNWDDPVLVEVLPTDDNDIEGNHQATIGYTATSTDSVFNEITEENLITVDIVDNDEADVVISATSNLVSEGGSTTQVCAVLTAKPINSVTLQFSSSNTSEATVSSPLTIASNSWNSDGNCVTVTGVDDDEVDGPQNATIRVSGITSDDPNFSVLNTEDIDTLQITNQDNDTASFTVNASEATTSEAGGEVDVCVKLSARPKNNVVIPVASSDITEGSTGSITSITILPANWNSNNNCVIVKGVDDNVVDGDIDYQLITGDPTSSDDVWNTLGASDVADQTLTNTDDDVAGIVLAGASGANVTEGGLGDSFSVALSSEPAEGKKVVVRVGASNELRVGSAPAITQDLEFTSETWSTTQTVPISALDDNKVEGAHAGIITVSIHEDTDDNNYQGLSSQNIDVEITDNDTAVAGISTINDASEGAETNGRFRISLDKANHTGGDMVVSYQVAGTAVSDQHYLALEGTATIADGQSTVDVIVSMTGKDNNLFEGSKTVVVTLQSIDSELATVGGSASSAVVIYDDETAEVAVAVTQNGNEEDEVGIILTATLSTVNNTGAPITVTLKDDDGSATQADDYSTFDEQEITILDGSSTGVHEIEVVDDELFESITETVRASIEAPSHSSVSIEDENDNIEATITDNDTAEISVSAQTATANENPSSNGVVRFALDKVNSSGASVNITYSVSGTATVDDDYAALSGTATIANGQQYVDVTIDTSGKDDNDREGNETVIITHVSNSLNDRVSVGESSSIQVTIVDDEITGVTVTATDDTTGEDGSVGEICATLASRPSHSVTIHISSEDESKVTVPTTIVIERDNWSTASSNCVSVTGHDDSPATVTGTQNVVVSTDDVTSDDSFYNELTGADVNDVTIRHFDNDTPGVIVDAQSTTTSEDGTKSAVVQFRLQTRPLNEVVIPVSVSDTTEGALAGIENITISPDNWNDALSNQLTVSGVDDSLTDGDITYMIETGKPASTDTVYDGLSASDVDNVQLTNEDDDEAGVSFNEPATMALVENGDSEVIGVAINSQPADDNVVTIKATPADIQLDLGEGAGVAVELEFDHDNWNVAQQIEVSAFNDELLESDHNSQITYEIVSFKTTEESYKDYDLDKTSVVAIADDDTASVSLALSGGNEAGPVHMTATVTLSKENNTGAPITVDLNSSGGSATANNDYLDFEDTVVSISDGDISAQVIITVIDDLLLEGDENVEATISNASLGAVTVSNGVQNSTIVDNDTADVTISATTPTAYEHPAESGEYTVNMSKINHTGSPVTVYYTVSGTAIPGEDYTALSGSAVIPVDESSTKIVVSTAGHNDGQVEGSKTVIVSLNSASHDLVSIGNTDEATVTIEDDDSFTFSLQKIQDGSEGEADIVFRVRLSQVNTTGSAVTVQIADSSAGTASAGDDYQVFGGTVTIPNGQQNSDYTVSVIDDDDLEDIYETVQASISNASEGDISTSTATASIADNEASEISIEKIEDATENPATNGQIRISLDKANHSTEYIGVTYTINGSATAGQDYTPLSGQAMIPTGQNSTVIIVDTEGFNDDIYEGDETVIVTLAGSDHTNVSVGNPSSATVVISDDDPEPKEDEDGGNEETPPPNNENGTNDQPKTTERPDSTPQFPASVTQRIIKIAEDSAGENVVADTPRPQPIEQQKKDEDKDGIDDEEESRANNFGDGNGDGIPDNKQANVASLVSSVTNKPVTLESIGECSNVSKFAVVSESSLRKKDNRHSYPYGLVDFTLDCPKAGGKSTVTVFYDQALKNSNNWRKFTNVDNSFAVLDFVENVQKPIGASRVTAAQYVVQDGGSTDGDGKADGVIIDPAGYAVRSFYVLDLGWIIPVLVAGGFTGYAVWHRVRDRRRYR